MAEPTPLIAAVQGAPSAVIQDLFRALVEGRGAGARIVGVLEENPDPSNPACLEGGLRVIGSGETYPLFQDLGASSAACGLDAAGVLAACAVAQTQIEAGCDLVILSKFGRLEAERGGLRGAFEAATAAGVPLLTAVSPRYSEAWARYAAPLYVTLPPDLGAICDWWRRAAAKDGRAG